MQHTHWKITQPCHEPLDKMDKISNGHYCHSCRKEVIDLDGVHPNEIGYREGDKICGRLKVQQPIISGSGLNKWSAFLLKWMGASALFFIPLKKGKTQNTNGVIPQGDVKEKKTLSRKKIVVGTLRDENNRPIKAQVTLQDSTGKIIAQTDSITNGRYRLPVDTANIEGDSLSLIVGDSIRWTLDSSFIWSYPKDTVHVYTVELTTTLGWTVNLKVDTFISGNVAPVINCGTPTVIVPESKGNERKEILKNEVPVQIKTKNPLHHQEPKKQEEQPEKSQGVVPPATNSISRHKNNPNKK